MRQTVRFPVPVRFAYRKGKVSEPERRGADAAEPPAATPLARADEPRRQRRWWKTPAAGAAAAVFLAAIGLGSYFVVNALFQHRSSPSPPRLLAQVPGLPPGAVPCPQVYKDVHAPFNAGARGTPMTSCPFVEQVRGAYAARRPTSSPVVQLSVISPATEKWYDLTCIATGNYATCVGGAAGVIYLYNQ